MEETTMSQSGYVGIDWAKPDSEQTVVQEHDTDIECRIDYARSFSIKKLIKRLSTLDNGAGSGIDLVHRTDYHEDGSQSEYFYLEISEEQFNALNKR